MPFERAKPHLETGSAFLVMPRRNRAMSSRPATGFGAAEACRHFTSEDEIAALSVDTGVATACDPLPPSVCYSVSTPEPIEHVLRAARREA